ncbi:retron St85 family RNA-directed DNA polymerase [Xenorhabdus bovienii]|uniref:retron St85 family RNA-directed DNA polymerase n=1 Tax=Xenorhabdus bovienii TaxID=40576 RepID=UPI00237CC02B|nr:retron St85 family RNA-directed DNA polymerase [Xenorhabdus bovienii]MDE1473046.1 retron St85 family RNA-directed DNA polymerase [Xenorhabdus bovienii]
MTVLFGLVKKLGISEREVITFLSDAPKKYKVYSIPKRSSGHRIIAQPSKRLKEYQTAFLKCYLLPVHPSAMAYRQGLSIKDNANYHKDNQYLLKMDLENFFNSITPNILWESWNKKELFIDDNDRKILQRLLFWCPSKKNSGKLVLSIGAPTSPAVSNSFLYNFDEELYDFCLKYQIAYTRYADDLTFSTNQTGVLFTVPEMVKKLLIKHFDRQITINHGKTIFSSKAHNRHITGVTITNDGKLSIGRQKKRYIKHLVYQFELGVLSIEDIYYLQGLLAFAKHIEPLFIPRLVQKYSKETLKNIFDIGSS